MSGHGGSAVLKMVAGGPQPTIVLDYGKDVGGVPYFVVRSATGLPTLQATYSEGMQYLGDQGDNSPSLSAAGDQARVDSLIVNGPDTLTTDLIQGGERFERISLTSPGTVILTSVGVHFDAVRTTANDYKGWFDSSSNELNRIWYDGAYTVQLDEVPAHTVAGPWNIINGALNGNGGGEGILRKGTSWTNYTMSFDTQGVHQPAGWVVRAASPSTGYLFVLGQSSKSTGGNETLSEIGFGATSSAPIATVTLPAPLTSGDWYHVTTSVVGPEVSTSIDGHEVAHFDTASLPANVPVLTKGSVGFLFSSTESNVKDLKVIGSTGTTLYADRLAKSSAVADFVGPSLGSPDSLPVLLDGAKRDRDVWSGDMGVSASNDFYTTDADAYVRDSLELLGSYQGASGDAAGQADPTAGLGTFPNDSEFYSTSYSMEEVNNIATYYLFTGDLDFVRSEWPMITRELAYDRSLLDARGLVVTNTADGMDWDYYDGAKVGEVTAYNDIYFETLKDAAMMASALGMGTQATTLSQEQAALGSAINQYLFNPATDLYVLSNLQPDAVAQDANSLAVDYAVAPAARDTAIMDSLYKALPTTKFGPLPYSPNIGYRSAISPYVTDQEVEANFDSGNVGPAMSILRTVWGHMDAPGPDFTGADWELVGSKGNPGFGSFTSLAHGWASGATADLSAYVLGVQPVSAGFKTWLVQPSAGSLSWVEGNVPTPHGTIAVRWAQDRTKSRFALQVSAPSGTNGTISVPVSATGSVVTVQASHPGSTQPTHKSITTKRGSTSLPFAAHGGVTYHFEVVPVGGSNS